MLNPGAMAPDFSVLNQDGDTVTLAQYRGQGLLLWWYPKADTPG